MRKKIAIFSSEFYPLRGGIGTYACEMASGAAELGADVTVFVPDYGEDRTDEDKVRFSFNVVRFQGGRHSFKDLPRKIIFVFSMLMRHKFDVVLAADWPFYLPVKLAITSAEKKYMVHGSEIIEICSPFKNWLVRKLGLFGKGGVFFTNSEYTKGLLLEKFGDAIKCEVRVELLGTSKFWFCRDDHKNYREIYDIPQDSFLILTVARLTPRKGHLEVINALKMLPVSMRKRIFYGIVGPAYDEQYLKVIDNCLEGCGYSFRVFGEIDDYDLRGLYSQANLFCLVGKFVPNGPVEGFGLVYLEAAAQGLPAISGRIGGMPEAVINEEVGIVVDGENPTEVSDAIIRIINSDLYRKKLGFNAKKRAEYLSWPRCAKSTFDI